MARVQLTRPLMWAGVAYAKGDTLNGLTTDEAIGLVTRGHGVDLDGVATVRNVVAAQLATDGAGNPAGLSYGLSVITLPGSPRQINAGGRKMSGIEVEALNSTSGWTPTTNGGSTITTGAMSDGQTGVVFNLPAGASVTTYLQKTVSIDYTQDTVLGLWCEFPDPGRIAAIEFALSNDAGTFTNWKVLKLGGSGGAVFAGTRYFLTAPISAATAGGGSFATEGTIQTIRIRVLSTYKNQGGIVKFRSLCVNSMSRPRLVLAFDDGFISQYTEAYRYMSMYGLRGTLAVITGQVGNANYMTLAQHRELYDEGWDIVGHTTGHVAFNSHNTTAICASQVPAGAGNLTLNGSVGSNTFDTPRHVVVTAAGDQGIKVTVTGLDSLGAAVQEDVYTWTGRWVATQAIFSRVTQVAVDQAAAAGITVGQCRSYAEQQYDIATVRDYLIANGMPRGALHLAFPQGEFNATTLRILAQEGIKSARVVSGALQNPHKMDLRPYELPGYGGDGIIPTAAIMNGYRASALSSGGVMFTYLHKIVQTAATNLEMSRSEFRSFIDSTVSDMQAGKIDLMTQTQIATS